MSHDIIEVTVLDSTLDVISVTVLDSTDVYPVSIFSTPDEIYVTLNDDPAEVILVEISDDPAEVILVTLTDGVSDQDLFDNMTAWHWPQSLTLQYLPDGKVASVTKADGEIIALNRVADVLETVTSTDGWTKTLVRANDRIEGIVVT